MRDINKISDEVYYQMGTFNQLTIDMVEEVESCLTEEKNCEHLCYNIQNILEIINPEKIDDIRILNELLELTAGEKETITKNIKVEIDNIKVSKTNFSFLYKVYLDEILIEERLYGDTHAWGKDNKEFKKELEEKHALEIILEGIRL